MGPGTRARPWGCWSPSTSERKSAACVPSCHPGGAEWPPERPRRQAAPRPLPAKQGLCPKPHGESWSVAFPCARPPCSFCHLRAQNTLSSPPNPAFSQEGRALGLVHEDVAASRQAREETCSDGPAGTPALPGSAGRFGPGAPHPTLSP